MCPVKAAAAIVQRISTYDIPRQNSKIPRINLVQSGDMLYTIPFTTFLQRIRLIVDSLSQEKLAFTSADVGTHSNCSGGAMGMFLTGTPVYTIMLMGRWSSDAFMPYIRKQVLQLSHGISSKMLTYNEFFTVPEFGHSHADGALQNRGGVTLASSSQFLWLTPQHEQRAASCLSPEPLRDSTVGGRLQPLFTLFFSGSHIRMLEYMYVV
jgi:hypothetical protein